MERNLFRKRIEDLGGSFQKPRSQGRGRQAELTETVRWPRPTRCSKPSERCSRSHVIRVRSARLAPAVRRRCEVCLARWR